jgi:hypothetical protein
MFCPSSSWSTLKVKTGNTSRWFKARASECSDCLTDLHHRVTISSPAGIVYNVCLYRPCGSLIGCTASSMEITAGDSWGGDNSFDYYIEVKYISGSSCSNWSLTVEGTSC